MQHAQKLATIAADFAHNNEIRRWASRILVSLLALWILMIILGVEILTGTSHSEGGYFLDDEYVGESYTCTYWTGAGYRFQEESPYSFTACPVWRWGRQFAE